MEFATISAEILQAARKDQRVVPLKTSTAPSSYVFQSIKLYLPTVSVHYKMFFQRAVLNYNKYI